MRFKNRTSLTLAALALCLGSMHAASASIINYDGLYAFGDSLSDTGNIYKATAHTTPVSPPYYDGHFSNGPVWLEDLAGDLDLGPVRPSLEGGNDYAYGGAQTGQTLAHDAAGIDLPTQLRQYQAATAGRAPSPDALYTLWIGSNDVKALATAVLNGRVPISDVDTSIKQAVSNVGTLVNGLADDGLQNLLALDVPDLSTTPDAIAAAQTTEDPAAALAQIRALTQAFNGALTRRLTDLSDQRGFKLNLVDTFSALDRIVAQPGAYGFSDVTNPCWTGNFLSADSGSVCANPDAHLFWDGLHPTEAGHAVVAQAALAALNETTPVPEPGSRDLLVLGLVLLAVGIAWRRRSTKNP